ncbi:MAG: arylsulfatase A-like enzyme [Planctomycetota bacterium]|jgi:arylsulfatase A-like enzyme
MRRSHFLLYLPWVLSALSCVFISCQAIQDGTQGRERASKPNILIILADDLGYADCGFTGSMDIRTPNLDLLAGGSMVFTDAHVSASVCAPSRAGLLTGQYQQEFGFECNLGAGSGLLPNQRTIATGLTEGGYSTLALGKWHLGGAPELHPMQQGFEHFTGLLGGSRSYFPILDKKPSKAQRIERDGTVLPESSFAYFTDFLTSEAVAKIGAQEQGEPFFMYLAYTAPHSPNHARPDLFESYAHIEHKGRRKYASMVTAMDEGVGRVVDALRARGELENTLIVFLSDNGGATTNHSDNGPWRGMKGSKWEGGHRVPFFIHWPASVPPGTYAGLTSSLDILPTVWSAAGVALGEQATTLDGVDLLPTMQGTREEPPHERLFWRRAVAAAVRDGDWKTIRIQNKDGSYQDPILVNLADDPSELENHAKADPTRTQSMLRQLTEWERSIVEPRWLTAEIWRDYQRAKHQPAVLTRKQERSLP